MRFIIEKITKRSKELLVVLFLVAIVFAWAVFLKTDKEVQEVVEEYESQSEEAEFKSVEVKYEKIVEEEGKPLLNLSPPDIQRMKREGCVVDGFLNRANKETSESYVLDMINNSNCYYLHRSIETWLSPPDFKEIEKTMGLVTKSRNDVVYGMFIAEAIDSKAEYFYEAEDRNFDFGKMCRPGSKNFWGEHTCKPSFSKKEYRAYVLDIARRAIDLGVQSFMFGQVYYQDYITDSSIKSVLIDMRAYAKARGVDIVIGAQTNDIDDEKYLRQFDFIEGGLGINPEGKIEKGPCYSRWWQKKGDWCWALLWNNKFSKKANNVFVHLDWSGIEGDDMGTFAHMSREKRAETLQELDEYFTKKDIGFLFSMITPLYKENGGCHGKSRKYYTASNEYSCQDEDVINELLKK